MSDITELMASNDPMATPVMSLGPSPPQVSPGDAMDRREQNPPPFPQSMTHMMPVEPPSNNNATLPPGRRGNLNLTREQQDCVVVVVCAFVVLLPNVQALLTQQLPVLKSNETLFVLVNSVLIALLYFFVRDSFVKKLLK